MFTGLIEEIGIIKEINKSSNGCVLTISCEEILADFSLGDSISVNGVCQSVVEFGNDYFKTELSNETLNVTTFKDVRISHKVNLERALLANKRLDGHFVSGHIDSTATLTAIKNDGFSKYFTFKVIPETHRYIVYKGSVAINGISLTVSNVDKDSFSVAVIPITIKNTSLSELQIGDSVNIETDLLGKYVEKFLLLNNNSGSKITENFLKENGFS